MDTSAGKIAKWESVRAQESYKDAETRCGLAEGDYRRKPTRQNLIALKAAHRLLRESQSKLDEWQI